MARVWIPVGLSMVAMAIAPAAEPTRLPRADSNGVQQSWQSWGCCRAASGEKDPRGLGGFAPTGNLPKPIPAEVDAPAGALSLIALPDRLPSVEFPKAMALLLVNRTGKTVWLDAVDSSVSLFQEARHSSGAWKAIEYPWTEDVHAWCGNSFHQVGLPNERCWIFPIPRYQGPILTHLRVRLDLPSGPLYSNFFPGSVHPDQFTRRRTSQEACAGSQPRWDPRKGMVQPD